MKKLILIMTAVAFTAIGAQAQDSKPLTFSIGLNAGLNTNSPSPYSIIFGADVQADYAVAPTLKITGSVGYENFTIKSKYTTEGEKKSTGVVPLLAGAKFFFGEDAKLYGHAQLGYSFGTEKGSKGDFTYAPSLGYYFSPNFDGAIKYWGFSESGHTTGVIGVRLAYNF